MKIGYISTIYILSHREIESNGVLMIPKQLEAGLFQLKKPNSKHNGFIGRCNEDGWKWTKSVFNYAEANQLLEQGYNISLVLSSLPVVVVDIDNEDAQKYALKRGLHDTLIERTRRGYHFYYQIPGYTQSYGSYVHKTNRLELKCTNDPESRLNVMCHPSALGEFEYSIVSNEVIEQAPDWIIKLIKRNPYQCTAHSVKPSYEVIQNVVSQIDDTETYDTWLTVGMAIHNLLDGSEDGLELWDRWSSEASNYNEWVVRKKYESFGNSTSERRVGFKRLLTFANKGDK